MMIMTAAYCAANKAIEASIDLLLVFNTVSGSGIIPFR